MTPLSLAVHNIKSKTQQIPVSLIFPFHRLHSKHVTNKMGHEGVKKLGTYAETIICT